MYRRVAVGACLQGGAEFLKQSAVALLISVELAAFLWVLAHQVGGQAVRAGAVVAGVFMVFWFRRALAVHAAPAPAAARLHPLRRLAAWSVVAGRSVAASVLIVATLTVPTVALAFARIVTSGADSVAETTAAVYWALPIAALVVSPVLIRLYLYYVALAAGRHDVGLADVWRWGRGNSLRILTLVMLPLVPALCFNGVFAELRPGADMTTVGGRFVVALALFFGLAWAAAALARALSGILRLPLSAGRR